MFSFKNYILPKTLDEAYDELIKNRKNIIIGGGSYLRMSNVEFHSGIDISSLNLDYIRAESGEIHIGAMTNFRELETDKIIKNYCNGIIYKSVEGVLGVQFRNNVTVGGTVFSKYGFSDLIPALLAVDAKVVLYKAGELSLEKYLEIKSIERDILVEIKIPVDGKNGSEKKSGSFQCLRKSSTDYSVLNMALVKIANVDENRDTTQYRISIGARPSRATLVTLEIGNNETKEKIHREINRLIEKIEFGTNMRGSEKYRQELAKALVKRGIEEVERIDIANNN